MKKIPLGLLFKPKHEGKDRKREKTKIIIPINSYPTRNRKIQKSSKKIQKNYKTTFGLLFKPCWERPRKRESKNYRSDQFLPDP